MSNKNSVWVCLEQTGGKIAGVSYEMLSGARKLANELSGEVCAVLMGHQVQAQAKEAFAYGADKVYVCDNENLEHYNTGAYCKVLEKLVKENEPEILLLAATTNGRDLAGRLASRLATSWPSSRARAVQSAASWSPPVPPTVAISWLRSSSRRNVPLCVPSAATPCPRMTPTPPRLARSSQWPMMWMTLSCAPR